MVARHLHSKLQSYPKRWSTSRASPLGRGLCLSAIERRVTMKISLGRSDCRLLKFDNRFAESADSSGATNVNNGWFRWNNKRWPRREGYARGMLSCKIIRRQISALHVFRFTKPNLTLRKNTMLRMESSSGELRISTLEVILFHTSARLRSHYFCWCCCGNKTPLESLWVLFKISKSFYVIFSEEVGKLFSTRNFYFNILIAFSTYRFLSTFKSFNDKSEVSWSNFVICYTLT